MVYIPQHFAVFEASIKGKEPPGVRGCLSGQGTQKKKKKKDSTEHWLFINYDQNRW